MTKVKNTVVVGAGLVGSLWACYLAKYGYKVDVYERRSDMRKANISAGKSINLAMSDRGLKALAAVGLDKKALDLSIPMYGRLMHNVDGKTTFQAYGKKGQAINSISRGGLNELLVNTAESNELVNFHFNHKCNRISYHSGNLHIHRTDIDENIQLNPDLIFGADGAFSKVRYSLQKTDRFNYEQFYLEHGYKELIIPPAENGGWRIEKEVLHIWPRESFMLIALPNLDGSFTCTLFAPFVGNNSFEKLNTDQEIVAFFEKEFPDALKNMPSLVKDFNDNPTSSLAIIKCYPWSKNNTLLIGDASHAIVPFYGQGMNAGFEDCTVLDSLKSKNDNWESIFIKFEKQRKPNADAIADLALQNFIEMRDHVADKKFLIKKKIEKLLMKSYPNDFLPQYSMVTFSHIPYNEALIIGKKQKKLLKRLAAIPNIIDNWENQEFEKIIQAELNKYKAELL